MLQDQQAVGRRPARDDAARPLDPKSRVPVEGEAPGQTLETDAPSGEARKPDDGQDARRTLRRRDRRGGRVFRRGADPADRGSDGPSEKKPNILRRHPFWALGIAVAVVAVAAGAYVYWLTRLHPFESTDDAFVDARQFSIAPKVAGYIVDVPVTDNQHVETGAVAVPDRPARLRGRPGAGPGAGRLGRGLDPQLRRADRGPEGAGRRPPRRR